MQKFYFWTIHAMAFWSSTVGYYTTIGNSFVFNVYLIWSISGSRMFVAFIDHQTFGICWGDSFIWMRLPYKRIYCCHFNQFYFRFSFQVCYTHWKVFIKQCSRLLSMSHAYTYLDVLSLAFMPIQYLHLLLFLF